VRGRGAFGPAQPAPTEASAIDALAAYTGRTVHRPGAATPNRALWEKGDFTRIADTMRRSGEELVAQLAVTPGMRVLDLGCGDGTTAIPAAQRGADVLGVDIATNLVAAGRRRARTLGVDTVRFETGDARDLSWIPDDSFDAVHTFFGAMFAPEPHRVAAEMVRVTRPGGRVVMGNWIGGDPTLVAQILRICSAYAPPPPNAVSPVLWGKEDEVRERFGAAGIAAEAITCEPDTWTFRSPGTPAAFLDEFLRYYGPTMNAYAAANAEGKGEQLRAELEELFTSSNTATGGGTVIPATFLRVTVRC
jgi:SAM-dependent methyltransferase